MKRLSKKTKKYLELVIVLTVVIISIFLWETFLILPIKLLVVLLHEISHGIAAIISGGKIISLEISSNLGGECVVQGGNAFVVTSAGYVGSLIWGAAIFISSYNKKFSLWTCSIVAIILILFTANFVRDTFGIILSLAFAVLFIISPRFFYPKVHSYIMKIVGLVSCLYVIVDIKEDLITLTHRDTDAQTLFLSTGVPAIVWGSVWFLISITAVFFLIRFSHKEGMKI